ncbi:hypothetical protein [Deinococcus radiodurans]|jgi:hypothetical protein|nr:hypothetical protein [Deinococcus radiodurans]ANC72784.1 hypothetical protein A2G07_10780 [Deinococcus radiodurans R1 = ATCC 13939 = DSM 20539]QIP28722.1 hypothetical protein HAV23_05615 [Deinococcus radiodurans]QIP32574.1 hypothetical protein HAV35_11180 [Deinococcus radiodurans]UID69548.1 hypothetical protein DRO_0543 [Deinococcus radiodurans R1 = ATCC 13939 = DSM 20539]UTA50126.1 hypothetical protein MSS93_10085 [Deinococcus radiodurans]
MTGPERTPDTELAGLPSWLYPAGFWVAVVLLAVGVLFPDFAVLGVAWVGLVPVLAALWVLVTGWQRDRRLGMAAALALAGLGLVVVVKGFL